MDGSLLKSQISIETAQDGVVISDRDQKDALDLARTGKKQVLKRRFGLVSMIGFASGIMVTWEGAIANMFAGLANGGPSGVIYGYLACWAGMLSVYMAMAELASMLPCAGGQYHWVNILAPTKMKRAMSYLTGWITVVTWVAAPTTVAVFSGLLIQGLVSLNNPQYDPTGWQGTLLMWATLVFCVVCSVWLGPILPAIEIFFLILSVLGFFALLIPLTILGPHTNVSAIFHTFWNENGWNTTALAFFVGLQGNAAAFLGNDGTVHMAEEVGNSAVVVPRSMILSVLINGVFGFAIIIAILGSVGPDLKTMLETETSSFPWMRIIVNAFGSLGGATTVIAIIIILNLIGGIAALSSGSRMIWSFARERAIPGWQIFRKIDSRTSIPNNTVFLIAVVAGLLALINIGSSTVLNDVLSLVLEGFCSSYFVTLSLLLYRRLRGDIQNPDKFNEDFSLAQKTATGDCFIWGPWRLKGWLGTINNIVAICYLLVVMFFSFWPPGADVTADTMNWAVAVLGGVAIIATVYYVVYARKHYEGPRIEIEVLKAN